MVVPLNPRNKEKACSVRSNVSYTSYIGYDSILCFLQSQALIFCFSHHILWTIKPDLHQNLFPQAKSTYHPLKFLCLCWSMLLLQDQANSPSPTITAACAYIIYCHLEISMTRKHRPILPNHTKCLSISIHHSQTLQTKQNDPLENELYEQHQSQTLCLLLLDKCIIAGSHLTLRSKTYGYIKGSFPFFEVWRLKFIVKREE